MIGIGLIALTRISLIPMILLYTIGNICHSSQSSAPGNTNSIFEFEYDNMQGYDVFPSGESYALNVFSPCGTSVLAFYSDVISPAQLLDYNTLGAYMNQHALISNGQFTHSAYILAIQDATNKPIPPPPADPADEVLATTFDHGIGFAWSVIFVDAIKRHYPNDMSMIEKSVIHEMGHMYANLDELCDANNVMSLNHDNSSCVMGGGKISSCTGQDLSTNPHFCPADCTRIKNVK